MMAAAAQPRTRKQRLVDRLITRSQALPAPTSDYTVMRDLRIPMRDGTVQLADLYQPTGGSAGLILSRSPYGWGTFIGAMTGGAFALRGFSMLLTRCRGTFGSEGEFEPWVHEIEDGADTVAWMREQTWFPGTFATYGGSYLGFTQWAILMDPPPELRAAVIVAAPHDFHDSMYQGGAFRLVDWLGWAEQVGRQEQPSFLRLVAGHLKAQKRARRERTTLADAAERLLHGTSGWYQKWIAARDPQDPLFAGMELSPAVDRVNVPVLLQSGWQDPFLAQTFDEYGRLAARGVDVGLTVGPWTHGELVTKGGKLIPNEAMAWLGERLVGRAPSAYTRTAAVKVYVTGADEWRDMPSWPPATIERSLHPGAGGVLTDTPATEGAVERFTYDPAAPTPTVGGPTLLRGGYKDDSTLAARPDVLTFATAPFIAPLDLLGAAMVELAHTTDNFYADLFVRVSDVDPKGKSRNVTEGFVRLDPAVANGTIRIALDPVAHRFLPGHRLRLIVAGGSHPAHERNLGTADNPATSARTAPSNRVLTLDASRLVLPVGTGVAPTPHGDIT